MVVPDTAVATWLIGLSSCACATDAMLTTPAEASATVHLFNFIWFLLR
jgi:hypothetical protein